MKFKKYILAFYLTVTYPAVLNFERKRLVLVQGYQQGNEIKD